MILRIHVTLGSTLFLVSMFQIMAASRASKLKYQIIINQVHVYMSHKKLPMHIQNRLIMYYDYKYKKRFFRETVMKASVSGTSHIYEVS